MEYKMLEENRLLYEQNLKMKLDAHKQSTLKAKAKLDKMEGGAPSAPPVKLSLKRQQEISYAKLIEEHNPAKSQPPKKKVKISSDYQVYETSSTTPSFKSNKTMNYGIVKQSSTPLVIKCNKNQLIILNLLNIDLKGHE